MVRFNSLIAIILSVFIYNNLISLFNISSIGIFGNRIFAAGHGRAEPWQLGFQTPASPVAEGIISFHDDLMVFITLIFFFVLYILSVCLYRFSTSFANKEGVSERLVHASTLEIVWTIIPAIILIIIAIPSFSLLYSVDEIVEPLFTIKAIGHQWYWSYEFLDPEAIIDVYTKEMPSLEREVTESSSFDSYMLSDGEILDGYGVTGYRLLSVDNHLYIPTDVPVRVLISSSDVLHSWAVPSLGVKLDACPGRLNQTSLFIKRAGEYFGQCSEICGVNHAFMPIGIIAQDWGFSAMSAIDPRAASTIIEFLGVLYQPALQEE